MLKLQLRKNEITDVAATHQTHQRVACLGILNRNYFGQIYCLNDPFKNHKAVFGFYCFIAEGRLDGPPQTRMETL